MKITVGTANGLTVSSKLKTVVAIVLDRSGSMASVAKETIQGLNREIQAVKDHANPDTKVFLTLFDHEIEERLSAVPANQLEAFDDYQPRGSTRMFDAVGSVIESIEKMIPDTEKTRYMVSIISDGQENSSTIWTSERLAEKIQQLQDTGRWTFSYIGANVDLSKIQKQTGIDMSNVMGYQATSQGTVNAFASRAAATAMYLSADQMSVKGFWDEHAKGSRRVNR